MVYIAFNLWVTSLLLVISQRKLTSSAKFFIFSQVSFVIMFLPAFQFDVGTDYFSYVEIFNNQDKLDIYFRKEEFGFYYLVELLKTLGLPSQSLFISVSVIASLLIVYALNLLHRFDYNPAIVFLCFFLITGMLHNQMNGIRNYLAAYLFLCAILSKFSGRVLWMITFSLVGSVFHQTFYLMVIFLLIPSHFYEYISRHLVLAFFLLFLFWGSGVTVAILGYFIDNFLTFYSHYRDYLKESSSIINVVTKAYYIPLQVWFLFWYSRRRSQFSRFELRLLGVWVLGSSLYLSLLHTALFFRLYHYFVFFSVIPAYYFLASNNSKLAKCMVVVYLFIPYLLKVVAFPAGEYDYQFYLFR